MRSSSIEGAFGTELLDPKPRSSVLRLVIAAGAMVAATICVGAEARAKEQGDLVGRPAPDFALADISGRTMRLSDFKGKIVLLDFWATWCAPCRREIPGFNRLQRQFAASGFTVLGVALDEEGAAVARPLAQRLGINYPIAIGTQQVAADYGGIQALPTAFLIGRDGRILGTFVGARDESEFAKIIRQAEGKGSVSPAVPQPN
jgi:peroxiredoxin